ncbi:hypothetical protein ACFC1B_07160 [Streptomyces xiamenensis]|uniref:hypothetical protein n=1 Tax=Streptomyces xiamenensis TaxID=408015 RepID=UPI0035D7F8F4
MAQDSQPAATTTETVSVTLTKTTATTTAAASTGAATTAPASAMFAANPLYAADGDLTIYDLVESDLDTAEEILERVAVARADAEATQAFAALMDQLLAFVTQTKIPGSLYGWTIRLRERADEISKLALALAEQLPQASEAIATAGNRAADRHQQLADTVRDLGHSAPAEAPYHKE